MHLSLLGSEGCHFLAIARAFHAADYAISQEFDGGIEFVESVSGKAVCARNTTHRRMICDNVGSDNPKAFMKLLPHEDHLEQSCLSAVLLLCPTASSRLTLSVSVSDCAYVSGSGLLAKVRRVQSDLHQQLSLM